MNYPIGVLIMAYGGPNSLEEIPGYLADIRHGRVTTPAVLAEITHNYTQIGGKSPLLEFTAAQVAAIRGHLDPDKFKVYLGMRHWAPWIEDAVREMLDDGISRAVSLVLAPHFSKLSIAKYHNKIEVGLAMFHGRIEFAHIDSYHDVPGLIGPLAARVQDGLHEWPEEERADVHMVFSAHSLPERILKMGDPYDSQLRETARLVAAQAGLPDGRWSWSYQSAGRSPEPWLGPQLQEYIPELAAQGIKNIVSVPVGFVCDHVEILFDIDIQAQAVAREFGVRLVRPSALNTDPVFMKQLADLIVAKADEQGWL
ncbi:MAG: ferrochelatase [Chloroflexi bacterium]|nr:ferrochelatase [Ardenticatenaceae bacterium]MBL1130107.1 ferrochelatase [Chloroflexota bacterium]NOG36194.1 ferrochelatase [Chloroflexota bacterium]GIK56248.1 MAG: ferrochelatase [Chloroflexota bacterium]